MSQTSELFLRVAEADEADYGKSLVRIHKNDRPRDINWGDHINISLDKKNWVNCKLEPAGDSGIGKIYIGIHPRGLLNRDIIVGIQPVKIGEPHNFYIKKASSWKVLLYIAYFVIVIITFAFVVSLSIR